MKIVQKHIRHGVSHITLDITSLETDTSTPFDIYIRKDKNYVIILDAGTLLTSKIYSMLSNQKTLYISKQDKGKQELNCTNLESYVKLNKDISKKNIQFIYKVTSTLFINMSNNNKYSSSQIACIETIIKSIVFLIQNKKEYLKETIEHFSNEYELDFHSLHVTIYAISLGNALKLDKEQLLDLGTAALLHDIGLTKIDQEITHKNTELTPQEVIIVSDHPKLSVEIIEHNRIHNPYIIDAVIHHHERYDGSGYPDQLHEHQINEFASILAICDVFDALTNNRPYRKKYSPFEALKLMMKDPSMQNKFNDHYLQIFLKTLI